MSEWKEYKMEELMEEIAMGPFGSNIKVDCFTDEGIPVLNGSNLVGFKLNEDSFNYVTKEKADSLGRSNAYRGDVVITHRGTLGQVVYVPYDSKHERYVISQSQFRFKCNKKLVDVPFLVYYFHSREGQYKLLANASQVGVPALARPTSTFKEIVVTLPSLEEQRRIASILTSLDDKIDLLRRENATLEAMAETLFRQWFVVEAKEEWEEGKISDLIEFNPTRKLAKDSIAPFLEMSNLSTSTYAPTSWYNRAFSSGTKFQNGDTLLARITPCLENGKTAYIDFLNENQIGWGSTEFIVMHTKQELHPFFSYVIAKYQDFRDYAESCMSGSSGRQRVDVENLKNYPISIPDESAIEQFNIEIETMVSKMCNNNKQIQTLIQTRDGLLPRLMNGEIRV